MSAEIVSASRLPESEWWELWHSDPAATPFQSPAWLLPWRTQFRDGESLILALRQDGRLVALLPLFRHHDRLLLWGSGTSDWLDGLFAPGLDPADLLEALPALAEPVDLFQLRADSPLLSVPLPPGWTERRAASASCVVLALPPGPGRHMVQNLRYYSRRARNAGVGEPELADAEAFDELVQLHTRRRQRCGQAGVLADARVLAWHRAALPLLQAAGLLRLYVLRLRGTIVSALYVLASKHRAFYYIGGFDPQFHELGLGTVLIGHAIGEAEREGDISFDFLRGEEPYKYRWGATNRPSFARYLAPPPAGHA